jgi:hypothetical protein
VPLALARTGFAIHTPFRLNITMKFLLLLIPCLLAVLPIVYNLIEPRLFGFPFFYWFQILLIPTSCLTIFVFHRMAGR